MRSSPIGNGLQAAIKALDDVVVKAVDSGNPLAREQLKLVSRYLGFVQQRLSLQHEHDRCVLRHYVELAGDLLSNPWPDNDGLADLRHVMARGADALANAEVSTAEIGAATDALTAAISVLVRRVANQEPDLRRSVEARVVTAYRVLLDVERAWYLPMGFEPDPGQVPELSVALSEAATRST